MTVGETNIGEIRRDLPESFEIQRIRNSLTTRGWALTDEDALAVPGLSGYLAAAFADGTLIGNEVPGYPIRRSHTRDVVEYRRECDGASLNEYRRTDARPRTDLNESKQRVYRRVFALSHPPLVGYMNAILSAVPQGERQAHGTLGLDFFRTYGDVVPVARHQDLEEFSTICVAGCQVRLPATTLYRVDDPNQVVVSVALSPGDIMVFRDRDFTHGAAAVLPRFEGDEVHRDVLVLTVHYRETYVGADERAG